MYNIIVYNHESEKYIKYRYTPIPKWTDVVAIVINF